MAVRIDMPAGATPAEVSDDMLSQLGTRAFSMHQEADGLHIDGNVTQAEVESALAGFTARRQARFDAIAAAATADITERTAVESADAALTNYIDTPNASITPGQTYTTVKLLCRIARWLIRRELRRTF